MRPIFEGLKTKYSFGKTPLDNPVAPSPSEGQKFENGAFSNKNGNVVKITQLMLLDFGIVVETRSSTDDADSFIEDAITWASKEHGLSSYEELPIKKHYVSELNLMFDKPPPILNQKLSSFLKEVSSLVGANSDFIGIQLGTDPTVSSVQQLFKFERETLTPHGQNRFYSMATTTTENHLKLLEQLESALA